MVYDRVMKSVALLFDLDGTLWDASFPVAEAWTETGQKILGPSFSLTGAQVRSLMGMKMDDIIASIAPGMSPEERQGFSDALLSAENESLATHPGSLFPEEKETLAELKRQGYRLFIVSNCQKGYIENFLPLVEDGTFEDHLCWGDTKAEKNVTMLALMQKHGIRDALYIGDTRGDETQSRLASLPFLFAAYGFGEALAPDGTAYAFSEIPGAIELILSRKKKGSIPSFSSEKAHLSPSNNPYFTDDELADLRDKLAKIDGPEDQRSFLALVDSYIQKNGTSDKEYAGFREAVDAAISLLDGTYQFNDVGKSSVLFLAMQNFYFFCFYLGILVIENQEELFLRLGGAVPKA